MVGVVQEGEVMPSADLMRCLPQAEVVHRYLCCHLGERVGLKRRYSAFSVLFGYFWLSCLHFHRVWGKSPCRSGCTHFWTSLEGSHRQWRYTHLSSLHIPLAIGVLSRAWDFQWFLLVWLLSLHAHPGYERPEVQTEPARISVGKKVKSLWKQISEIKNSIPPPCHYSTAHINTGKTRDILLRIQ